MKRFFSWTSGFASVGALVGGPVGAVVGGFAGAVVGTVAAVLDDEPPPPPPPPRRLEISDESWRPVWDNVCTTLQNMAQDNAKRPITTTQAGEDVENCEAETRINRMCADYEKAIQDGVEKMSCGRIGIIGNGAPLELMTSLIAGKDGRSVCTISNDKLCPVSEQAELVVLGTLANKAIQQKSNPLKDIVAKAFSNESSDEMPKNATKNTIDDTISNGIKNVVSEVKYRAHAYASASPNSSTPALIHVTNHDHSEQAKHLLPILITSRSIFLIVINENQTSNTNQDELTSDICRCITYINSSLSDKARRLFEKLPNKSTRPSACPYPEILIVGTYNSVEHRILMESRIESIKKWVKQNCSDSAQHKCNAITVNTTNNQAVAEIVAPVAKFITRGLEMSTPLSWELFRQIFSYVTKNVPTLNIERVAIIASLCDISLEEFPSVLNYLHEHGALLYYANVEYLQNIVIIDPNWLQDKLCKIFTPPPDQSSKPMWTRLLKQGILVAPLCEEMWQSEEVEGLPTGLAKLLEKYHLITPIEIDREISDYEGPKYFAPFAMQSKRTASPSHSETSNMLYTAPLHFIFPLTKYLPIGVFNYLIVTLASKRNKDIYIDFKSDMFSDQITYWYGNCMRDKVILSATLTSISAVVERKKCCENEYETKNFWLTCQEIFLMLTVELESILKTFFAHVRAEPAFYCTCSQLCLPHYVSISIDTESTSVTWQCNPKVGRTFNINEQMWLKMPAPFYKQGKLYKSEIDRLLQLLKPEDRVKLAQALEIADTNPGTYMYFKHLIHQWSERICKDGRRHLLYHLKRLGIQDDAAFGINNGIFLDKKDAEREELLIRGISNVTVVKCTAS